ncbi:EAL domain-containing protein [Massilia sp. PAMC28688]|uniref:EAL and HDOD domain-containing protein n=1 Tax=Massilia sp. PAMC28688 TaxID=2861283 RepID=UPI001C625EF4|nr:EAL domain-containing protein [Massilia sp. PAMC28688]QYF94533.1 EAL domain-containing protein [Massilia sp. PAMC28688]
MSTRPADPSLTANVRDFFLGRQPILDRNQALFGYEMLFRTADSGDANIDTDISATAAVIAHAAQLGLDKAIGEALAFINVDAEVLMSDIFVFLPRDKVVLEIVETMTVTPAILARIGELAGHGFRFALDDVVKVSDQVRQLLPLIDFVKLDLRHMPRPQLVELAHTFRQAGKKLLAEKVESRDDYDACVALGFDYFQGFYFAKPAVISGRKLSPSQLAVIEMMKLITSDADNNAIERAVKKDVTLALNLLRLVNSAAVGARYRIDSLNQAVTVLGRRQLQRWLQILLYAEPSRAGQRTTPLLMLATTRGRMLELLAQRLQPSQRNVADVAFTVGIMSLMDTLFGMSMEDILQQIPVSDDVSAALLNRTGFFGELLHLTESIEQLEDKETNIAPALRDLALSADDLVEAEMAAFEWSDNVVRYAI